MRYPEDFPQDAQLRVEVVRAKSERDFIKAKQCLGSRAFDRSELEQLVKQYILSIFFAFANEALQAAYKGVWPTHRIQPAVEEFGLRLIEEAELHKCHQDPNSYAFLKDSQNRVERTGFSDFQSEIWGEIERSERWVAFLGDVAALAETNASDCSSTRADSEKVSNYRRAMVDAYIGEVLRRTGKRITRTLIWRTAAYKSRTEFERWQRCDPRATKTANERFTRILKEKPHLK